LNGNGCVSAYGSTSSSEISQTVEKIRKSYNLKSSSHSLTNIY